MPRRRLAVVGAGWAGLAAAVRAVQAGCEVTLLEAAARAGGRARSVEYRGEPMDNGQHILIGAYQRTLDLMRTVGVDERTVLHRLPLALIGPDGQGLRLAGGRALPSFVRGVLAYRGWSPRDRMGLLRQAAGWGLRGFRCEPDRAVSDEMGGLPPSVRTGLIDPLCIAALNTPSTQASAAVFLRVLRDGLFSGPGSADLLLPRKPLGELLPAPALAWLRARAATVHLGQRVQHIEPVAGAGWRVDSERFDEVVLACPAAEAARLAQPLAADWARAAAAFDYEPIVTAWFEAPELALPGPMVALHDGPAQFAFDLQRLQGQPGRLSLVVSGAGPWLVDGTAALEAALVDQVQGELRPALPRGARLHAMITEKRATFRCTVGLRRPPQAIGAGLVAAGDYVQGPYPATLEGAVRSGESALRHLLGAAPAGT